MVYVTTYDIPSTPAIQHPKRVAFMPISSVQARLSGISGGKSICTYIIYIVLEHFSVFSHLIGYYLSPSVLSRDLISRTPYVDIFILMEHDWAAEQLM